MLEVILDNLEHHKNEIRKLLGDDFINEIGGGMRGGMRDVHK